MAVNASLQMPNSPDRQQSPGWRHAVEQMEHARAAGRLDEEREWRKLLAVLQVLKRDKGLVAEM